ncbi:MAG TPA: serine hydrolase domain-containing protein [Bryobacteraceae bacterium]|nr:serine hydrolase domain-containing protein [Bryobacteraceae bacterium]
MLRTRPAVLVFVGAALCCAASFAQPLPMAAHPEDVGFSSKRLDLDRGVLKADVDAKRLPGAVLLIVRDGKIAFYDSVGYQDRAAQTPMKKDSIFRVASMSKPITTVAAMILAEENKLDVGAPVAQYLPEFKDVKVGPEGVPPKRPMTVQDLMRHTSGLTYGLFGNSPVDQMYRKADIFNSKSLADMVKTIASMPLLHQPGEFWEYSVSTDVLGRVVEVVSGMDLDTFVRERVTGPLKMNDTGFWVKPESLSRLAKPEGAANAPFEDATKKPNVFSGGGGMLSTAGDYARFSQMLLNGGQLDGVRILSPKTVALMTSDQLPPNTERHTPVAIALGSFGPLPEMGTSFGLGFAIRVDPGRNPMAGSVGDFSWGGITGTLFWVDPQTKLVAVLMAQTPQLMLNVIWRQTREMVYQAMTN